MQPSLQKVLFGHNFRQEYICVPCSIGNYPVRIYLDGEDITTENLFLGYKPVVIGIRSKKVLPERIKLQYRENKPEAALLAELELCQKNKIRMETADLYLFHGHHGKHSLLPAPYRLSNSFNRFIRSFRKGNIRLEGNLYEQVRIAYSIPRPISVISVGAEGKYNFFPTDLFGQSDDHMLIDSLRISGKANGQVEMHKKMLLSEMDLDMHREVYALGPNHMKDLQPVREENLIGWSDLFSLPVPKGALAYKELELVSSTDAGIHRLHTFKVIHSKVLATGNSLAHLHYYAATWLQQHGYEMDLRFR